MKDISYDYYKTFYHVARLGSFTRAAAELMRGQPNITKTISNLEGQLGCKLFLRSQRGVILTPEGEKLYAHIAIAFQHIQEGEQEIAMDRSLQSGTVRIASSEVALRCCLLPVLEHFRKQYPNVRIKLTNHSTPQAIEALKNGLADFAVVSEPHKMPEPMMATKLVQVRQVPACGDAYTELRNGKITLAALSEYPMICMNPGTTTYQLLQDHYSGYGLPLRPDIEVATADQLLPLIRSNLGIGFVPEGFLTQETGVHTIDLLEPIPEVPVCLIKRTDTSLNIAAKELERLLLSYQ